MWAARAKAASTTCRSPRSNWKLTLLDELGPHFGCVAGEAIEERHRRQTLEVHRKKFSRVLGLLQRLGNDQRDAIADMAHEILRQYRPQRTIELRARRQAWKTRTWQAADFLLGYFVAGEHGQYAGRAAGSSRIKA